MYSRRSLGGQLQQGDVDGLGPAGDVDAPAEGDEVVGLEAARVEVVAQVVAVDTGSIAFTLNSYFADFFPKAIEVQAALQGDPNATLHYLTHPWLVYNFLRCDELEEEMGAALDAPLQCPNATTLEAFNASVRRGTIAWRGPAPGSRASRS